MTTSDSVYTSPFRIVFVLVLAGALTSALVALVFLVPFLFVLGLLPSLFFLVGGLVYGTTRALPALLLFAFPFCVYLDRRRATEQHLFIAGGAVIAGWYWVVFRAFAESFAGAGWVIVFVLAGVVTGSIYWRLLYSRNGPIATTDTRK